MSQNNDLQTQSEHRNQGTHFFPIQKATQLNLNHKHLCMNQINEQNQVLTKNRVYTSHLGENPSIIKNYNVLL